MNKTLLLDSHVFLWLLQEPHKIGDTATKLLQSTDQVYISLATIWELGIKHQKGRLDFSPEELIEAVDSLGMGMLKIDTQHVVNAAQIDTPHKDPFDKMLLAQAKTENLNLITADAELLKLSLDYVINSKN